MGVRADPGLVPEEELGLLPLGLRRDLGILLLEPPLHLGRVLLVGPPQGALGAQPELAEEPTHGAAAEGNAEPLPDHGRHHRCRPQGEGEVELLGALPGHGLVDPAERVPVQLRRPAAPLAGIQGVPAPVSVSGEPAIHGLAGYPEDARHHFGALPGVDLGHGAGAEFGEHLVIEAASIIRAHTRLYHTEQSMSILLCTN